MENIDIIDDIYNLLDDKFIVCKNFETNKLVCINKKDIITFEPGNNNSSCTLVSVSNDKAYLLDIDFGGFIFLFSNKRNEYPKHAINIIREDINKFQ